MRAGRDLAAAQLVLPWVSPLEIASVPVIGQRLDSGRETSLNFGISHGENRGSILE